MRVQQPRSDGPLASYPEYGLCWLYDDADDPAEVTVFPGDGRSTTEWLTADVGSAVSLEEVR